MHLTCHMSLIGPLGHQMLAYWSTQKLEAAFGYHASQTPQTILDKLRL